MRSIKRTAIVLADDMRSAVASAEWAIPGVVSVFGSYSVKSTARVARMLCECHVDEMSESGRRKGSPLTTTPPFRTASTRSR